MLLNDRSLTNQKDGLSNQLNLTNQEFYVRLVDKNKEENNSVLAGILLEACSILDLVLILTLSLPFYGLPGRLISCFQRKRRNMLQRIIIPRFHYQPLFREMKPRSTGRTLEPI